MENTMPIKMLENGRTIYRVAGSKFVNFGIEPTMSDVNRILSLDSIFSIIDEVEKIIREHDEKKYIDEDIVKVYIKK